MSIARMSKAKESSLMARLQSTLASRRGVMVSGTGSRDVAEDEDDSADSWSEEEF